MEKKFDQHDKIHIRELQVSCIIGVNPPERTTPQSVVFSLTLYTDLARAMTSDSLEDTVNYRTLTKKIIRFVEASSFFLLEKLAEEVARLCLQQKGIRAVRLTADKPGALRFSRSVGIEVFRTHEKE